MCPWLLAVVAVAVLQVFLRSIVETIDGVIDIVHAPFVPRQTVSLAKGALLCPPQKGCSRHAINGVTQITHQGTNIRSSTTRHVNIKFGRKLMRIFEYQVVNMYRAGFDF